MTTDYKVTELFCVIDEFCKHLLEMSLLCIQMHAKLTLFISADKP